MPGQQRVSRRAVTRAAAWSIPVVATAAAAPAASASDAGGPVISGACVIGLTFPGDDGRTIEVGAAQFTITAGDTAIETGSTCELVGQSLTEVTLDQPDKIDVSLPDGGVKTITLTRPIAAGASLVLTASGLYMQQVDPDLTLRAGVLNGGELASAVSATVDMTASHVDLGGFTQWFGVCDDADAAHNRRVVASMTPRQKARTARLMERAR